MKTPILVDNGNIVIDSSRILAIHVLPTANGTPRLKIDMEGGYVITLLETSMEEILDRIDVAGAQYFERTRSSTQPALKMDAEQ